MFSRNSCVAHRFTLSLIIALLITASVYGLMIRTAIGTTQNRSYPGLVSLLPDDHGNPQKGLSREQRSREARAWHEANHRFLERTEAATMQSLSADEISQDINDIN